MRRYPSEFTERPRMLLAYADAAYASECCRFFRRLGWEVQLVASGDEARVLAAEFQPDVIVLEDDLIDESGWQTSAKIASDDPTFRIVIVSDESSPYQRLRAAGAKQVVRRSHGAEGLAGVVLGPEVLSEAI